MSILMAVYCIAIAFILGFTISTIVIFHCFVDPKKDFRPKETSLERSERIKADFDKRHPPIQRFR